MKLTDRLRCVRDCLPAGTPTDVRHAFLVLATYADADGRMFPSLVTLADDMGVSLDSARRRIRRAVRTGYLTIDHAGGVRGSGDKTLYRLVPKGCIHTTLSAPGQSVQKGGTDASEGWHPRRERVASAQPEGPEGPEAAVGADGAALPTIGPCDYCEKTAAIHIDEVGARECDDCALLPA